MDPGYHAHFSILRPQVAWKAAAQRTEELDTTKELAISSTDRKSWMDRFKKSYGFSLPASRTPHDTTLGLIKRQLDSDQLQFIDLKKVKIFGETSKPKSVDLSVNGTKVVTAESEEEPLKAHTFLRALSVLMNAYSLSGSIPYQMAVDHVTFFEDKVFPQNPADRIPLAQASTADEELRRHWMAQVRMGQRSLLQAIQESKPMMLSLMTRQLQQSAAPLQQQKRPLQQPHVQPWVQKQPRTDNPNLKTAWLFKHPASHKQFCFNWNSGGCTNEKCPMDREHSCAFPGCTKKDCRAVNHADGFRPSFGKAAGKGRPGR